MRPAGRLAAGHRDGDFQPPATARLLDKELTHLVLFGILRYVLLGAFILFLLLLVQMIRRDMD